MINLFNIPEYTINTGQFSNLLHDKIVTDFEQAFADYVGAKYAVSFNSATSALFLICRHLEPGQLRVPSLIPYVVPTAILNAGAKFRFTDDTEWVGSDYLLGNYRGGEIWDSAQAVEKDAYHLSHGGGDILIFSFYPTKPVGSCDGGMIVTDDEDIATYLRSLANNGMSLETNNWERRLIRLGHKMYMNSISGWIANENLKKLDAKKEALAQIRDMYNTALGYSNTSDHLYRIMMMRPDIQGNFIKAAKVAGITCGIHYQAAHLQATYVKFDSLCPQSLAEAEITVSIPFHEALTPKEVETVIQFVRENDGSTKK